MSYKGIYYEIVAMMAAQVGGGFLYRDLVHRCNEMNTVYSVVRSFGSVSLKGSRNFITLVDREKLSRAGAFRLCSSAAINHGLLVPCSSVTRRKRTVFVAKNYLDTVLDASDVDEDSAVEENCLTNLNEEVPNLTESPTCQPQAPSPKRELIMLSLPAIAGQVLEPLAQLMETAYIGRLGPVELASAGVSMSVFNIISKLFNLPLLSIATSFVAEDISKNAISGEGSSNGSPAHGGSRRQQLSSVSSALLLAVGIGFFEASALALGSGLFLNMMGISPESPMRYAAQKFLHLRALGAPALVVTLALQGVFRGFKDTKTPLLCLGVGNFVAIFLFPLLMYYFQLGVTGAAVSTVISQYIVAFLMVWHLSKRVILLPPKLRELQFGGYVKSGGFLIGRTLAVLMTMTLATSMAARQGAVAMAAHQICLQVWLAVSLLTDALAASGQALIASSLSRGDYRISREVTDFVLKIGVFTGVSLAAILGVSFSSLATLFTKDIAVLDVVKTGILFVSASQPLNALAYIFDGLHYGVSDFPYAACSMMIVGAISSAFLLYAPSVLGLQGVWSGLAVFMGLRTLAGFIRLMSKSGPWWFMHEDLKSLEPVA